MDIFLSPEEPKKEEMKKWIDFIYTNKTYFLVGICMMAVAYATRSAEIFTQFPIELIVKSRMWEYMRTALERLNIVKRPAKPPPGWYENAFNSFMYIGKGVAQSINPAFMISLLSMGMSLYPTKKRHLYPKNPYKGFAEVRSDVATMQFMLSQLIESVRSLETEFGRRYKVKVVSSSK